MAEDPESNMHTDIARKVEEPSSFPLKDDMAIPGIFIRPLSAAILRDPVLLNLMSFPVAKKALVNIDIMPDDKKSIEICECCERDNKSDLLQKNNQCEDVGVSDYSELHIPMAEEPEINLQADIVDNVLEQISPLKDEQSNDGTVLVRRPVLLSDGQLMYRGQFLFQVTVGNLNALRIPYGISQPQLPNPLAVHGLRARDVLQCYYAHVLTSTKHFSVHYSRKILNPEDELGFQTEVIASNEYDLALADKPGPSSMTPGDEPRFLFEIYVMQSSSLPMPFEVTEDHFPLPPFLYPLLEYKLELTDPNTKSWSMKYMPFTGEQAYIVVQGWEDYMKSFNLRPGDRIRFFMPRVRNGPTHFNTKHIYRPDNAPPFHTNFEFIPENFLFEVEITDFEEEDGILMIDPDWGEALFPFLSTTEGEQQMVKFTDFKNRDWYMLMEYHDDDPEIYLMFNGWSAFTTEYDLHAGDLIRFYDTEIETLNYHHFMIQFERNGLDD